MSRYRVLVGTHIQNDPDGKERVYYMGEVFETDNDMLRFNGDGGRIPKFEKLFDSAPQVQQSMAVCQYPGQPDPPAFANASDAVATLTAPVPNLDNMSVKELQALAATEQIDLKGSNSKNEIIKIIRTAIS